MKLFDRMRVKDNKGLTLVEVIVSITILAVISIPLMAYFSDSLKYSAVTAKQQKATALAQNITEGLKSQQFLLKSLYAVSANPAAVGKYNVPYLEDQNIYTIHGVSGHSVYDGKDCFLEDGSGLPIGVIEYSATLYEDGSAVSGSAVSGNGRMYDVKITLSTDTVLNNGVHPVIYGMDNSVDVIAIESSQITDALVYFKSINAAYGNPSALLTDNQILDKMKRTIILDFDYVTEGSDHYYLVKVSYLFKCSGLRDGSTTPDTFDGTTPLCYTRIKEPEHLYLMYNRLHPESLVDDEDHIMFRLSNSARALGSANFALPELFLIVQNIDSNYNYDPLNGMDYLVYLGIDDTSGSFSLEHEKIHTNMIEINKLNLTDKEFKYGTLKRSSYDLDPDASLGGSSTAFLEDYLFEITDRGSLLRAINIQTDVYEHKSDGTTGDKLASYSTSKGE